MANATSLRKEAGNGQACRMVPSRHAIFVLVCVESMYRLRLVVLDDRSGASDCAFEIHLAHALPSVVS